MAAETHSWSAFNKIQNTKPQHAFQKDKGLPISSLPWSEERRGEGKA